MTVICPHCGASNEADIVGHVTIACIGCGVDFETEVKEEQRKISIQPTDAELATLKATKPTVNLPVAPSTGDSLARDGLAVSCNICGRGNLHYVEKNWLPGPLVSIGAIIFVPSLCAVLATFIIFCVALFGGGDNGLDVSHSVIFVVGISTLFLPVVCTLIGMVLMSKKKHLECSNCRVLHPAA